MEVVGEIVGHHECWHGAEVEGKVLSVPVVQGDQRRRSSGHVGSDTLKAVHLWSWSMNRTWISGLESRLTTACLANMTAQKIA